jgi:DNA-binding transcriptional LysR family regulator
MTEISMKTSDRIGRRMKLHDLHVLMSVVEAGSMGKAASLLNTTQSAMSRSITQLEHAIGVRLLDRSRQGVEPTNYGRALVDGGAAVFDDLRQAVRNIEFLADPSTGHVTICGSTSISSALLPSVFGRLRRRHPGLSMHLVPSISVPRWFKELRERKADLALGRLPSPLDSDIDGELLYHEQMVVVAGPRSKWLRQRKIRFSDLANEPWLLPPPETLVASLVGDAFRSRGMQFPPKGAATGPIDLLFALLASGPFLLAMSRSLLQLGTNLPPLKVLPVEFPSPPWPVGIMTLKNRTQSPVTRVFIECAREVAKPLAARHSAGRAPQKHQTA